MKSRLYIFLLVWLPTLCGATTSTISLSGDTTIHGGWTIAAGDTVVLCLNGDTITLDGTDYGDFGLHVSGHLSVTGRGGLTHSRPIAQLVEVNPGGSLHIDGGTWTAKGTKRGLIRLVQGELVISGGNFQPDAILLDAVGDTLCIAGGQFDKGIDASDWIKKAATIGVSLRGGSFELDPRNYGLQPDEGYAVYTYPDPHPTNKNYYVDTIPADTTTDTIPQDTIVIITPDTVDVHGYETETACDSLHWRGQWYYGSGNYTYTTPIDSYHDSICHLTLTIYHSTIQHRQVRTCDSYLWRGRELTESGEYYDTLQTAKGCDSILHLSLTLGHSTEIHRDTVHICAGQTYTWLGKTYTRAGVYQQILQTAFPCDSFVELHLIIDAIELDSVPAQALHGFRMLVLDHNRLAQQGYTFSSDAVSWYRVVNKIDDPRYPADADDTLVGHGDCYTDNGAPLQGSYYAIIRSEDDDPCHLPLRTILLTSPNSK